MLWTERIATLLPPIGRVLIPIGLGLLLRSMRLFGDEEGALLRKFVVRFTVPVFVFFSLYEAKPESIASMMPMAAALVMMTVLRFAAGWAAAGLFRGGPRKAAVHACITFGNYGWMGLGVAQALLGAPGTQRVVYFILLWWPVFYAFGLTIGYIHLGKQKGGLPVLRTVAVAVPPIAAVAAGLLMNLRSVPVPAIVTDVLRPFGDMTVPLILLGVGLMLDVARITRQAWPAFLVSAVALAVGSLAGWALAALMAPDALSYQVLVLEGAMPVATVTPVLEENYDMDKDVVHTAIVLSTAVSLVTVPIVASFVLS